jgi:GAG-pre-integrase domain
LNASTHKTGKKLMSKNLIWHLNEEANSIALKDTINKSNEAMLAATAKAQGWNGKGKGKPKPSKVKCSNCQKTNHTDDQCWSKCGGQEGKAPEWWLKKQKNAKGKKSGKNESTNATEQSTQSGDKLDNYAMLGYMLPEDSSALVCTSDFKHEAHIASQSNGTILDCSASSHFMPECSKLLNYREISPEPIQATDGHTFSATGKGNLKLELLNGNQKLTPVTLKNVYYSPHLAFTLMSVGTMDQNGYDLHIKGGKCIIQSPKSDVIGQIPLVHGLYHVTEPLKPLVSAVANTAAKKMSISKLHRKMGHVNYDDLCKMVQDGMVMGIKLNLDLKPEFCEACIKAKATCKLFPKKSETMYQNYSDKVVANTWGPALVESLGHKRYFQLYQNLSSHEECVYFNHEKSESFDNYKKYEAWV